MKLTVKGSSAVDPESGTHRSQHTIAPADYADLVQ